MMKIRVEWRCDKGNIRSDHRICGIDMSGALSGRGLNLSGPPRASLRSALGCALAARWAENPNVRWAENPNARWAENVKARWAENLNARWAEA